MLLEIFQRYPDQNAENEIPSTPVTDTDVSTNLCPHQRQDRKTKSVHYFHAYATKNHADISALSDARQTANLAADIMIPD